MSTPEWGMPAWMRALVGTQPQAARVHQLSPVVVGMPTEVYRERAKHLQKMLDERGIIEEQAQAYKPGLTERIYNAITPYGYEGHDRLVRALIAGESPRRDWESEDQMREDAWRFYLGLPQKAGTFAVSEYRPSRGKNPEQVYYRIPAIENQLRSGRYQAVSLNDLLRAIDTYGSSRHHDSHVMGNFKFEKGNDEEGDFISYYDRWDLDQNPVEGERGRFGKPFEIYGRVYYNRRRTPARR